jgi:hypothetical protein
MPRAESLSMIASSTSQTVCKIARHRFYDTGCLLTYAFSLRFPYIMSRTLFVLGRFHEEGQTCGPTKSERLRRQADGLCSSNTKVSERHVCRLEVLAPVPSEASFHALRVLFSPCTST